MERKIGEIFTYKGKTYKTVLAYDGCKGCAFDKGIICLWRPLDELTVNCKNRKGNTDVIFKEIKDMDIKNNQLTIDIPEGMEIDMKHSNLAKGIIKFKNKQDITYSDVYNELNDTDITINTYFGNKIKLRALVHLMNIAKYYNNDWQPNWSNSKENKYCIKFDYHKDRFYVDYNNSIGAGDVFFKNSEDARTVINNPNFKSILNTIYKN